MRYLLELVGRRIMQLIPVMLGVSFLAFCLLNLLPGGTAIAILGSTATNAQIAELNHKLGLDRPFWTRYGVWLWHVLHGNLGSSLITSQSVVHTIAQRLPTTVELVTLAMIFALTAAIIFAVIVARKPYGIVDWIGRAFSMTSLSVPGFVLALLLILLVAVKLHWLPAEGFTPLSAGIVPNLKTMALPVLATSFDLFAGYSRILRADMIDQYNTEDYVLTARSKGISSWRILSHHVLKNSLFSMITVVGARFGVLIGGAVVTENIFGLPGMGQLLQSSIYNRDYTVVQGEVIVIACAVVGMNLITDLSYLFLDPRVRYGSVGN